MKTWMPLLLLLTVLACRKSKTPPEEPLPRSISGVWIESSQRLDTVFFSPPCDFCASLPYFNLGSDIKPAPGRFYVSFAYQLRKDSIYMFKQQDNALPIIEKGYKIIERSSKKIVLSNFLPSRSSLSEVITLVPLP